MLNTFRSSYVKMYLHLRLTYFGWLICNLVPVVYLNWLYFIIQKLSGTTAITFYYCNGTLQIFLCIFVKYMWISCCAIRIFYCFVFSISSNIDKKYYFWCFNCIFLHRNAFVADNMELLYLSSIKLKNRLI